MAVCKRCRKKIPEGRLEALPHTKLCKQCSEEVGSDFEAIVIEENVGTTELSEPILLRRPREIQPLSSVG